MSSGVTQLTTAAIGGEFDVAALLKNAVIAAATAGLTDTLAASLDIPTDSTKFVDRLQENVLRGSVNATLTTAIEGGDLDAALLGALQASVVNAIGAEVAEEIGAAYRSAEAEGGIDPLEFALHKAAHAALGCGLAAGKGGDCASGAVGGVVGELIGEAYLASANLRERLLNASPDEQLEVLAELQSQGVDIAKFGAALSAVALELNAQDAADAAGNAAENNALFIPLLLIAARVALDVADAALLAWDAYQLAEAIEQENWERAEELSQQMALDAVIDSTVGIAIPGTKVLADLIRVLRDKGLGKYADTLEKAIGNFSSRAESVADGSLPKGYRVVNDNVGPARPTLGGGNRWVTDADGNAVIQRPDGTLATSRNEIDSIVKESPAVSASNVGLSSAEKAGILREASNLPSGNRTLTGTATRLEADELGKSWVGPNYRVASDGKTLLSADGLRQYRPPAPKPNSPYTATGTQANFQQRLDPNQKTWTSNAHLDISN